MRGLPTVLLELSCTLTGAALPSAPHRGHRTWRPTSPAPQASPKLALLKWASVQLEPHTLSPTHPNLCPRPSQPLPYRPHPLRPRTRLVHPCSPPPSPAEREPAGMNFPGHSSSSSWPPTATSTTPPVTSAQPHRHRLPSQAYHPWDSNPPPAPPGPDPLLLTGPGKSTQILLLTSNPSARLGAASRAPRVHTSPA